LKLNNQILISPSKKVSTGDQLSLELPEPKMQSLKTYKFKLDIIYEDKDIIIPRSNFVFKKEDIVVFLAKRDQLPIVENMFRISSF